MPGIGDYFYIGVLFFAVSGAAQTDTRTVQSDFDRNAVFSVLADYQFTVYEPYCPDARMTENLTLSGSVSCKW